MNPMEPWQWMILLAIIAYVGICFGMVAKRHGRSPLLWGVISILSPVNLIVLGYWAIKRRLPFSGA